MNVRTFVRIRPIEKNNVRVPFKLISNKKIAVNDKNCDKQPRTYTFDGLFNASTTQTNIFKHIMHPVIEDVLQGYNCTIFTYGQSGTGKTYTMQGIQSNPDLPLDEDPCSGFIPKSLGRLFDELNSRECDYALRVSFLGICNEELIDLLSCKEEESKLRLMDDSNNKGNNSVFVLNLEDIIVADKIAAFKLFEKGSQKLQSIISSSTSRCHAFFSITVHFKNSYLGEESVSYGKLNLVDIGSSENLVGSLDSLRDVLKINQSLLTLNRVIMSLNDNSSHIPYRESKLTRLLQDSLGGSTKTSVIATLSSNFCDLDETTNTLNVLNKAKNIVNNPHPNKPTSTVDLKAYAEEISNLNRELDACRDKDGFYVSREGYAEMNDKISRLVEENKKWKLMIHLFNEQIQPALQNISSDVEKLNGKNQKLIHVINKNETHRKKFSKDLKKVCKPINKIFSESLYSVIQSPNSSDLSYINASSYFKNSINDLKNQREIELNKMKELVNDTINNICKSYDDKINTIVSRYESKIKSLNEELINNACETETLSQAFNKHESILNSLKLNNEWIDSFYENEELKTSKICSMSKRQCEVLESSRQLVSEMSKNLCEEYKDIEGNLANTEKEVFNMKKSFDETVENTSTKINEQLSFINLIRDKMISSDKITYFEENQMNILSKLKNLEQELKILKKCCRSINDQTEKLEETKSYSQHHKEKLDLHCKECCTLMDKKLEPMEKMASSDIDCLVKIANEIKARMEQINNHCNHIVTTVDEFGDRNKTDIKNIQNEIGMNVNAISSVIENTQESESYRKSVLSFIDNSLTSYVPTGDTPKRQEYSHQLELKGSSPQEVLRGRFRTRTQNVLRDISNSE